MNLIPKTKFMWLVVAIAAYAYYNEYADRRAHLLSTKAVVENTENANSTGKPAIQPQKNPEESKNTGITGSIVNKISQTETGKVVVNALIKNSMEKKYGDQDFATIQAKEGGEINIIDLLRGKGAELNCGATAVLNYDAYTSTDIAFDSTKIKNTNKPLTVIVGGGQVIKGLEAGIVGMREGGRRKITIPASLAFDAPGFANSLVAKGEVVSYDVELVSVKNGPYKTTAQLGVIQATKPNGGKVLCGDNVNIKYKFFNSAGLMPNGTGEVGFVVGEGAVPVGVEYAVQGMSVGDKKTVEMPGELLAVAGKSKLPEELKFSPKDAITAEIEILPEAK